MPQTPIVRVGDVLIVAVQDGLRDQDAFELQADLAATVERTGMHGVLLDMSLVETIDSFLGRLLHDIAVGTRLLGAETVVIGLRPAVAITLTELGLQLPGVQTALTVERGIALLRRRRRRRQQIGRSHDRRA